MFRRIYRLIERAGPLSTADKWTLGSATLIIGGCGLALAFLVLWFLLLWTAAIFGVKINV